MTGWATLLEEASGYLDLGLPSEAARVLNSIPEPERQRPEVDYMHLSVLCAGRNWAAAARLARDASFRHRDNAFIHAVGAQAILKAEGWEAAQQFLKDATCRGIHLGVDGVCSVSVGESSDLPGTEKS